jgi:hypothetical protein
LGLSRFVRVRVPPSWICAAMTLAVWAHAAAVLAQRRSKKLEEAAAPATKSYVFP